MSLSSSYSMLYKASAKQINFLSPSPFLLERKLIASGEDRISWNSGAKVSFLQEFHNEECCASCAVRMAAIWPLLGRHFLSTPSLDNNTFSLPTHTHTQTHTFAHTYDIISLEALSEKLIRHMDFWISPVFQTQPTEIDHKTFCAVCIITCHSI